MKYLLMIILLLVKMASIAQVTSYTGGIGSGYAANSSSEILCPLFWGGNSDGYAVNQISPVLCPLFFGGSANGAAQNNSALIICPSFLGGGGDGYDSRNKTNCFVLLPIRFLDFYGVKEETRNIIHWRTEINLPVQSFDLERSGNGTSFSLLGTAAGTTSLNYLFTFIDVSPLNGINYYRLRLKESNGAFSYSPVIVLKNFTTTLFNVYPNPAKNGVTVYYRSGQRMNGVLQLLDMKGRVVRDKAIYLNANGNYIYYNLEGLKSGIYFLQLLPTSEYVRLVIAKQ